MTGVFARLWSSHHIFPLSCLLLLHAAAIVVNTCQIRVSHEDRDVWMLFLEKALAGEEAHFESAAQYCKNATERAQVTFGIDGRLNPERFFG